MVRQDPTHWQVLHLLKEQGNDFLSGTILASRLGLTRTAVWKHIQNLRGMGYDIQSHSKEGYRLLNVPDLLIPEEIVPGLKTRWLGRSYHHFPRISSTNDHALLLAAQGAPHGTVVVAEEQTHGRGRLKREWLSVSQKGIYFSILLRTPLPVQIASQTTLVVALALAKVIRNRYHLASSIKWPNDILVHHKKVAGILTEIQSDMDLTRFQVIGVGVNANYSEAELAGPFRYPASSLAIEMGSSIKRQELLLDFFHQFEEEYSRFIQEGFVDLLTELERYSAVLGRVIKILQGEEEIEGKALGFTPEGALRLLTKDRGVQIIWVGDVTRVGEMYSPQVGNGAAEG